jgi:hypothetical protein
MRIDPDAIGGSCPNDPEVALLAAEVRRLRAVIAAGVPALTDEERTPQTHHTPSECSVPPTLTDEERAAILAAADLLIGSKPGAILRNLLARLS